MKSNDKFKQVEENDRFAYASVGVASYVSAYYLAFNQNFFVYKWIAIILCVILMLLGVELLRQTVNYYFYGKKEFIYIAAGLLYAPVNYLWYVLFPCMYLKIGLAVVLFGCIMFVTKGSLQLIYNSIKNDENNKKLKVLIGVVAEIIGIISGITQLIIVL